MEDIPNVREADASLTGGWRNFASVYGMLRPPLRPCAVDVDNFRHALQPGEQRVLLLGVTPELSVLGKRLTAVDNSARMLADIWPGDCPNRRAILADWTDLPFLDESFEAVIGDGSLNSAPEEVDQVLAEMARVLAPRGKAAFRLFCAPEQPETLESIAADVAGGWNGNLHALKWRIAMTLAAPRPQASIPVGDILDAFNRMFPDRARLAADTGWPAEEISTIDAYVGADHSLGFPTLSSLRRALERHFSNLSVLRLQDIPWQTAAPPSFAATKLKGLLSARFSQSGASVFDTYAEIFEERARSYHSAMEAFPHARDAEFRSVLEPLDDSPAGTLCDMPAGGGYLASRLRPDLDYVGVDPASDFVACASREARIIRAEPSDVPLESASVDYVVSLAGLHHEPNLGPVFREMRRLVRDGGRVVVADVAHDTAPARFLNGFVARTNPMGHDGRFLNDDTAALLEAAGLRIVDDRLVRTPWAFGDSAEAGTFAGQLFGTENAAAAEVSDALSSEIGFTSGPSQLLLDWHLRRIVCAAD